MNSTESLINSRISKCIKNGEFRLDLSHLNLNEIPKEIDTIKSIHQLNLAGNKIHELPDFLFNLTNLRVISLQGNKIKNIPSKISALQNLIRIDLNDNKIEKISEELGNIKSLTTIYLGRNRLTSLPTSLAKLENLKVLSLVGNPLDIPFEILNSSIGALRNYLSALAEGDNYTLCEAKLLIVGEGGVGKTCLSHTLTESKNEELTKIESTKGIEIKKWNPTINSNTSTINLWDFGGQEIYHATHQYFLTKKSIYLFVWNARSDDDYYGFDYWLNIISLLSDNSPVIIVQNKCDERTKEVDQNYVTKTFKNVVGFINISTYTKQGIEELRKATLSQISKLEHFNQVLPSAWVKIRQHLEQTQRPFLPYQDYLRICLEFGLVESKANWLSEYFHVLGTFLHYSDNYTLSKVIFLQPSWATEASYRLFDDHEVIKNSGRFKNTTLNRVWIDYPPESHHLLLELIKKFELCFELKGSNEYIVPSRLPQTPPTNLPQSNHAEISYIFKYEFMPAGIIDRLIVKLSDLISGNTFWKNGVLIEKSDAKALITMDRFRRQITIELSGGAQADLLAIIRREVEKIHNSLNNLNVKQLIPCICNECSETNKKGSRHFFDYSDIERARAKKIAKLQCLNSFEAVEISEILGWISNDTKNREKEILNILNELRDRYDTKESLAQKANEAIQLKPNLFGIGININYLISKIIGTPQGDTQTASAPVFEKPH